MKRLLPIFFFATIFFSTASKAFSQYITYLDANYKPSTATNYTYKRVIKYVKPIIDPNFGTSIYGGMTSNPQLSGLHVCQLTDYYKTGEIAVIGNILTIDYKCSGWGFDGQVVAYYKDGTIKRKEPWQNGKLGGVVIYYDEKGNETKREEYVNGKLLEGGRFSVPTDSPLLGTWKYVEYYDQPNFGGISRLPPSLKEEIIIMFSPNSILNATFRNSLSTTSSKSNWKYTAQNPKAGSYELFNGDEMIFRGGVKWIDADTFEETVLFSNEPNFIGMKKIYRRVGK
jgi:hypothetical protein